MNEKIISNIKQYGKTARGRNELLKHLEGGKLTLRQAMLAHCYDCMGYYADGKVDCRLNRCPLHPFMAFNENKIKRTSRTMTEDHKAKLQAARVQ